MIHAMQCMFQFLLLIIMFTSLRDTAFFPEFVSLGYRLSKVFRNIQSDLKPILKIHTLNHHLFPHDYCQFSFFLSMSDSTQYGHYHVLLLLGSVSFKQIFPRIYDIIYGVLKQVIVNHIKVSAKNFHFTASWTWQQCNRSSMCSTCSFGFPVS